MSFWDDIVDWVSPVVDGLGKVAPVIQAGATIGSAVLQANANKKAASTAANAAREGADAVREGTEAANRRLDLIRGDTEAARSYLKSVYANPDGLTPLQEQQREELRRQTQSSLARSGLRGAGRANVAAMRTVESDFTNKAINENLRRADSAASQDSNAYIAATTGQAGLDAAGGRAEGDAIARGGLYRANAGTANAAMTGQALGDISSLIASERKGREGRYKERAADATGAV